MPDREAAVHTAQNGWLIEMTEAGHVSYLSLSEGREIGRPLGAWSTDASLALRFHREQDGDDYVRSFLHNEAPLLAIVPFKGV